LDITGRACDHGQNSIAQFPWPRDRNHSYVWKIRTNGLQENLSVRSMHIEVAEGDLVAPPAEHLQRILRMGAQRCGKPAPVRPKGTIRRGSAHHKDGGAGDGSRIDWDFPHKCSLSALPKTQIKDAESKLLSVYLPG
jgi:hypothetical protein